jgi:hypothetical protein
MSFVDFKSSKIHNFSDVKIIVPVSVIRCKTYEKIDLVEIYKSEMSWSRKLVVIYDFVIW